MEIHSLECNLIESGNGRDATDGFNALSDYDENSDGVIDAKDNVYNSLKVWQDSNQDGITDAGELKTLSELNISSINLDATTVETQESRNNISHTSTFTQDGVELAINDVWFRKNSDDVTYEFNTTVTPEIEAMPEINGSGRVKNLSHAMSEDAALKTKVQSLLDSAPTSNYNTLLSQTKDILTQWTHTDNISASKTRGQMYVLNHNYRYGSTATPIRSYRTYAYARDIAILENFAGREFTMYDADKVNGEAREGALGYGKLTSDVLGTEIAKTMQDKLEYLQDSTLIKILAQDMYGDEVYNTDTGELDYFLTLQNIESSFTNNQDIKQSANLLSALIHRDGLSVLENFDTDTLNDTEFRDALALNAVTYSVDAEGNVSGNYKGTIEGTYENDSISSGGEVYGHDGDDTLSGSSGHDTLHGGAGSDILDGGARNDTITGGAGVDTYVFNLGDGYTKVINGLNFNINKKEVA